METFQVKLREGLCLDWHDDEVFLSHCRGYRDTGQWWWLDLTRGMIMTQAGNCVGSPEWKVNGGIVHLRPCSDTVLGQHWMIEGSTGTLRNNAGFCISAQNPRTPNSRLQMWRCDDDDPNQKWGLWFASNLNDPKTQEEMRRYQTTVTLTTLTSTTMTPPGTSLYCFSLMLPEGAEVDLLREQAAQRLGIFDCDETTAFSSRSIRLAKGFYTEVLYNTSVYCQKGGEWGTYMNTPVFLKIWSQIMYNGRYKWHDWSVKADPDAVFIADRLRNLLRLPDFRMAEVGQGSVLHNCGPSFHGPLEVVSRRAMDVFGRGMWSCERKPQEDFFMSLCMDRLHVKVHFRDDLLADEGCMLDQGGRKDPNWWSCQTSHVAFHPFKSPKEYAGCWWRATGAPVHLAPSN